MSWRVGEGERREQGTGERIEIKYKKGERIEGEGGLEGRGRGEKRVEVVRG